MEPFRVYPRLCGAPIAIERTRPKPGFLMAVTPTMRIWNQIVGFLTDWEMLLTMAA